MSKSSPAEISKPEEIGATAAFLQRRCRSSTANWIHVEALRRRPVWTTIDR